MNTSGGVVFSQRMQKQGEPTLRKLLTDFTMALGASTILLWIALMMVVVVAQETTPTNTKQEECFFKAISMYDKMWNLVSLIKAEGTFEPILGGARAQVANLMFQEVKKCFVL